MQVQPAVATDVTSGKLHALQACTIVQAAQIKTLPDSHARMHTSCVTSSRIGMTSSGLPPADAAAATPAGRLQRSVRPRRDDDACIDAARAQGGGRNHRRRRGRRVEAFESLGR
jgi:hypothetical protein